MIHILREPNAEGIRVEDDVDESELVKNVTVHENDHERTMCVEYRFRHSDCVVHRSCETTIKKWPQARGSVIQSLR